ncbi:helix-turn-helix transcriptional regulator [Schleiferilactobacillus perolens]|jgi:AraC-like DNA-binding protein/mannose-6-phosphate isomerase-like protein (cupin superfamily)|uniref:helix-turn-helix transcriptional regulator n=1 Tax=Schleiferilactobacillus perolens TaxID=100468 RepID=UPI0023563203|nr:AraC family transcriptional regulator [Schleiferilactobacillus perolens]MCI2171377.1 AraC family transcriptional regulator [Schleiferilactobacillus perolens]
MAEKRFVQTKDLGVLYINHSDNNEKHWLHLRHTHYFTEIFYITAGSGRFLIRDDYHVVKEGDVLYIPPMVEHTEFSDLETPMSYYVIGVEGIQLNGEENQDHLQLHDSDADLAYYFIHGHNELTAKKLYWQTVVYDMVHIILTKISRLSMTPIAAQESQTVSSDSFKIKNYIDNNFADNIKLDDLAAMLHRSKYHLSHTFTEDYGVSISRYIQRVRLNAAKFLLETTNYSLAEVADIAGFTSQSYLTQTFQKREDMTPTDYRKEKRLHVIAKSSGDSLPLKS